MARTRSQKLEASVVAAGPADSITRSRKPCPALFFDRSKSHGTAAVQLMEHCPPLRLVLSRAIAGLWSIRSSPETLELPAFGDQADVYTSTRQAYIQDCVIGDATGSPPVGRRWACAGQSCSPRRHQVRRNDSCADQAGERREWRTRSHRLLGQRFLAK